MCTLSHEVCCCCCFCIVTPESRWNSQLEPTRHMNESTVQKATWQYSEAIEHPKATEVVPTRTTRLHSKCDEQPWTHLKDVSRYWETSMSKATVGMGQSWQKDPGNKSGMFNMREWEGCKSQCKLPFHHGPVFLAGIVGLLWHSRGRSRLRN